MEDAYQDAFHDFWVLLCRREPPPQQYMAVLRCIARRKSLNAMQHHGDTAATNAETSIASIVAPTHADWGVLTPDEDRELSGIVEGVLAALPDRQRLVAQVYLAHYEEFEPRAIHQRLTELVSAVTGHSERLETIKSLWHAARRKIGEALRRHGYGPQ
jgi:DNA-directed RNA polymerase specialized sigma24 family protein